MRKVIVSGGSRGIGAETVRHFSSLGDKVAFIYKSSEERARSLCEETGAYSVQADVSDAPQACGAINKAAEYLGGMDVLVINAGISHIAQICDTTDEDWMRIVNTNLSSAFYLAREASKIMVQNHYGRIITVGSIWGKCGSSCESAYSASKAGLRGLTMSLAKELAPSGITANCVEPGLIDTEMNRCFESSVIKELCDEIPAGRMGKAQEVASLIAFLASDEAAYINGQCIGIDGAWGI